MKLRSGIPRKIRSALIAFLALGGLSCFGAQSYQPVYGDPMIEPWRWRTFSDLRGLDAQCVIEAKDGTIWFGTADGLSCYDGMEWTRHLADDGVIAGRVAALSNQADGALNAGGWWGISRFSEGKWKRLIPAVGIRFADVRRLASAPDGSLWAATSWGALVQRGSTWTLYTDEVTAAPLRQDSRYANLIIELLPETIFSRVREGSPPGSRIDLTEVSADFRGRIWFGTKSGEVICHAPAGADPAATSASWILYNESDGLVGGRVPAILPLHDGTVWVVRASSDRACVFDGKTWRTIFLPAPGVAPDGAQLLQTRDGVIWVSARYVLFAYRDGQWRTYEKPTVPLPTALNLITQSQDGALWIVGPNTDVQRVDYQTPRWTTVEDLNFQWESPAGTQWFLHRSGRVVVHEAGQWTSYGVEDGLIDTPVALTGTRSGEVWAAGSHGYTAATAQFDGRKWIRHSHDDFSWGVDARGVFEAADGSMWFGAAVDSSGPKQHRAGILQFRDGTWIHHHQPGRSPRPDGSENPATLLPASHRPEPIEKYSSLGESRDGKIWAGRNVLVFHDGQKWEEHPSSLDGRLGIIESMFTTRNGDLWVGTRQYGAWRHDGRQWEQFQGKDSLAANSVRSIAETADGSLWVATDRDVNRFDGYTWTADVLPAPLAIPHEGGALKAAPSGALWINRHTVDWNRRAWSKASPLAPDSEFRTSRYRFQGAPPQTTLTTGPEKVSQPGNISVLWRGAAPWREARDFHLQFSYRLDDQHWSPYTSDRGHAFFALPSGHHRLEVRARDQDFNVDPTPATLDFVVLPPVWKQHWFILLMTLLSGLIVTQSVRVFLERGRLRKTNRALAVEIEARRKSAEEIRLLNASLEQRVLERTEALAKSQHRYQLLFDTMLQGVVHQDSEGRIIFMNPAAERILGKSREELIGRRVTDTETRTISETGVPFPPAEHPAIKALVTGQAVRDVVMGIHNPREAATRWIDIAAMPLFRPGENTPYEVYSIFDDITERREADLEVRRLNTQLDARARALEAANRELEAFSYSVSHDLRAPLRSIDGFSRMLLEDCAEKLDDNGKDSLRRICSASQRMGQLIDDMLNLARVSRSGLRVAPVDLSALASTVAATLRQANPQQQIEFIIEPNLEAKGDARLLQIVLENLFGNACKFSSGRTVARIEFGRIQRGGGPAYFVTDNGAGFDMSCAQKLFGAFQRFHTAAEFPGTGIGLATVQRIIQRHGGEVAAESQPDRGATFFFTLPDPPPATP
jgi:signal transduction histidine kinase/ligand-binding sensor domain-containing protein